MILLIIEPTIKFILIFFLNKMEVGTRIARLDEEIKRNCKFVNPPDGATYRNPQFEELYHEWTNYRLLTECKHIGVINADNLRKDERIQALKNHIRNSTANCNRLKAEKRRLIDERTAQRLIEEEARALERAQRMIRQRLAQAQRLRQQGQSQRLRQQEQRQSQRLRQQEHRQSQRLRQQQSQRLGQQGQAQIQEQILAQEQEQGQQEKAQAQIQGQAIEQAQAIRRANEYLAYKKDYWRW